MYTSTRICVSVSVLVCVHVLCCRVYYVGTCVGLHTFTLLNAVGTTTSPCPGSSGIRILVYRNESPSALPPPPPQPVYIEYTRTHERRCVTLNFVGIIAAVPIPLFLNTYIFYTHIIIIIICRYTFSV